MDDFSKMPVTGEQGLQFQIEDAQEELNKINEINKQLKEEIGMKRLTIASVVGFVTILGFMYQIYSQQIDKAYKDGAFQKGMTSLVEVVKEQGKTIKEGLSNQNKLITDTAVLKTDTENTKDKVEKMEQRFLTSGNK